VGVEFDTLFPFIGSDGRKAPTAGLSAPPDFPVKYTANDSKSKQTGIRCRLPFRSGNRRSRPAPNPGSAISGVNILYGFLPVRVGTAGFKWRPAARQEGPAAGVPPILAWFRPFRRPSDGGGDRNAAGATGRDFGLMPHYRLGGAPVRGVVTNDCDSEPPTALPPNRMGHRHTSSWRELHRSLSSGT
jgi:hypothetical protein